MSQAPPASLKILHILNDGPDELAQRVIAMHSNIHQVRIVDLTRMEISYERLVDEIFAHDRVISW